MATEQTVDINDPETVARKAYRRGWTEIGEVAFKLAGARLGRPVWLLADMQHGDYVAAEALVARVWAEEAGAASGE